MVSHFLVGNVPVSFKRIPLIALDYEPPRTKSFKTIEASVRVDAIASAGFKLSRTKLVDLIRDGDVRVNWTPVTKNGATLKTGDVVSVRGKGRLKIGEINPTKKGKFAVELILYLLKPRGFLPKIKHMLHPSLALFSFLIALAPIAYVVSNVGAFSAAEKLSNLALIPTFPAVIPISENIDAQCLAASEKTRPFVR
ncbi:hypothetical protein C1H46_040143 [Malus baccata]|uniref:RNA-binding S4 domain-containing protein n=1 Tax=Malus baccata TaxID=106549 RepID=A0A540KJD8_MALBA|nr:hypothetical protein C1H46_040143 [Malus baccata]